MQLEEVRKEIHAEAFAAAHVIVRRILTGVLEALNGVLLFNNDGVLLHNNGVLLLHNNNKVQFFAYLQKEKRDPSSSISKSNSSSRMPDVEASDPIRKAGKPTITQDKATH